MSKCSIVAAVLLIGCGHVTHPSGGPFSALVVPAIPPDTLPTNFPDFSTAIDAGGHLEGKVLPDIIVVRFHRSATQADKQAAIALVGGSVIGGRRNSGGSGLYIVHVNAAGSADSLFHAIGILKAQSCVAVAIPDWIVYGTGDPPVTR